MVTALVLAADGLRDGGRWVGWSRTSQDVGKSAGESEALRRAGIVLDYKPNLATSVVNGDLALVRSALSRRTASSRFDTTRTPNPLLPSRQDRPLL